MHTGNNQVADKMQEEILQRKISRQ